MFRSLALGASSALLLCAVVVAQGTVLGNGTPDPAYPNLWAWYDAAQGLNSSPTPLPHGTAVTQWDDLSVNARHLSRTSGDPLRLPTAVDDLSSCGPALRFDGNDYIWGSATGIGRCIGPRTIFVVVDVHEANGGYVMDGSTSSGRSTLHAGQTATPGTWHIWWSDSTQSSPNGFLMLSTPVGENRNQIHTIRIESNRQEHYINSQLMTSATELYDFNLGGLILGARYNAANGLSGDIREVLVYQESLGAIDQQLIEAYLAGRHPYGYGEPYGAGCPGTNGLVPVLSSVGCPSPGRTFAPTVTDAPPLSPCVVNFAVARASIPVGPCTILADPLIVGIGGSTDGAGTYSFSMAVPPGLGQLVLPMQAFVIDPAAAPIGVSTTNGLELRIF